MRGCHEFPPIRFLEGVMPVDRNATSWCGWGWAGTRYDFHGRRDSFLDWLGARLGVNARAVHTPAVQPDGIALPPPRLSEPELAALATAADRKSVV